MIEVNFLLAIVCAIGGLLVLRAYAPHIRWKTPTQADFIAMAMGIALVAHLSRTIHWDIYWYLSGGNISNPYVNGVFNVAIVVSEYLALKARLMMIPKKYRDNYNIITCVRFPRKVRITLKRKDDIE